MICLLDPRLAEKTASSLPALPGARTVVVHRADAQYRFLHDNAIASHEGVLFAAWYNCPEGEIAGESCIRGRRSADGGRTWSPVEVIASDRAGRGIHYVPVAFCSRGGRLLAFVSNMTGHDLVTRCEVFELDSTGSAWLSRGFIADHFLPNCAPVLLEDGRSLLFGRAAESSRVKPAYPAVAIRDGADLTAPWRVVRLSGEPQPLHPESTAWAEGAAVTAVVRGGPGGGARLFRSGDGGRSWQGPLACNLPASDSKLYAGRLSTGQRYLVWNWPPARDTLVLGVSRPGETVLSAAWALRRGFDPALGVGPEWSYPCAVEEGGRLHVIYTSEKHHSVMTSVPLEDLSL